MLQQFASVLGGLIRASDYAVRWGAGEFLLVLRRMPSEHAATLGERIRSAIAAHPFHAPGTPSFNVMCSVGVAELNLLEQQTPVTWEQIAAVADVALYWVKHNGRNGWAVMRPAGGGDMAGLAATSAEGAHALVASCRAELVSG